MQLINDFVDSLMARSTPSAPAWNLEHSMKGKPPAWNYIDGCMMKALLDIYYATGEGRYFDFVKEYVDFYVGAEGELMGYSVTEYNCDHINMGKVLFDLYRKTNDEKYKKAIELQHTQLRNHPRISSGNFWHKLIYPNQVWLDGLYMVQPFYAEYETLFNNGTKLRDILNQFRHVYDVMRDGQTGLYYHGYDESRQLFWADKITGLSQNFWTRSIGWFAMALVDTAEKSSEYLSDLRIYLKELMDAVLNFKDADTNLFYQVTDKGGKEGNYLETSGSCAIAYALMKGARLGYLPQTYFCKGKDMFDSIKKYKLTTDNGLVLKDICLVAGLGGMPGHGDYKLRDGTYEYYISEPKVDNDAKGVAPFLFSYAEVLRA